MNRDLEDKFFAEFGMGGAADMALDMVLWKHCGISSGTSTRAERYNDDVLAEIVERTEKAKIWLNDSNNGLRALYEEIEDNIRECDRISKDEIRRYVGKILQKFSWWAFRYNRWSEQLRSVDDTIYYGTIEDYYTSWRNDYLYFAEKLAVILAEREISLEAIQDEYDVKIFDGWDFDKHWILFGSRERMKRVLSKIQNLKIKTLPPQLDTPEIRNIFEKAVKLELMDKDYNWIKGKQLLACFAREISQRYGLGKGDNNGQIRINWQIFECFFNLPKGKLRQNYNDIQKTGQQPSDSYLVDILFN